LRNNLLIIILLTVAVANLARCVHTAPKQADPRGEAFTANTTCLTCHKNIAESYVHTVHAIASRPADSNIIIGAGSNAQTHLSSSSVTKCLECHASFIRDQLPAQKHDPHTTETFGRNSLLFGIDCQRCHGPAAQHANWHSRHPKDTTPRFITRIDTLQRQQRLDACAVCHSGIHPEQLSLFRFRPGHHLANYYFAEPVRYYDTSKIDIHGNQYQLLRSSNCFQSSTLDCMTCHNPHRSERDSIALFTQRCQSCHNPLPSHPGIDAAIIQTKCIDCHMPAHATTGIRTHRIAIYPDATKQALSASPKHEGE
jgi:hypothetical protein